MGEATEVRDVTAAQLVAWARDQGVAVDVMRTRVAGNQRAMAATVALMARMVEEAGMRAASVRALPGQDEPVQVGG